jgi:uncharacterized protein
MIIDANMHWLPQNIFKDKALLDSFIYSVPRAYGAYARLTTIPGSNLQQIIVENPKGVENLNYAENQYDPEGQIRDMNEAKIDKAVLRIPCWQEWLSLADCKKVNDMLAQHMKKYPGRFLALGVVPPWGTEDSFYEVERCINDLGFSGVQLAAHYGKLYLDEPEFRPYFKKLNKMGIPVVVHHTPLPVDFNSLLTYTNLRRQYGRCVDQGTAVGREIFSDLFEECPNLKLIHSMLGGGFFAYANMLAPRKEGVKEQMERFDVADKARSHLENNIFFDLSGAPQWGKAQLECAVKVLGADHILLGGSYPLRREWFFKGPDYVRSLPISEAEKDLILGGNAVKLFNIK